MDGQMRLRRLTGDDWSRYREFRVAAVRESPRAFGATPESTEARPETSWRTLLDAHRDPHGIALIGLDGDRWIGSMRVMLDEGAAWIYSVYVVPDARRTGVASMLMSEVLAWSARHAPVAMLHVGEDNHRARLLYERFGFVLTDMTEQNPAYPSQTEYVMRRPLDS